MKQFKNLLSLIIILLLFMNVLPTAAKASEVEYDYFIDHTGIVLTKYHGCEKEVVVPSEIDGRTISRVQGAFRHNEVVEKVTFSEGITVIGAYAFYGCSNLKDVILPDSVRVISEYAFAYCGLREMHLPANTHFINEGAFLGCKSLVAIESHAEPISPEGTALFIGERAFEDSGIRAIKTNHIPSFYNNSFTDTCYFTDNAFNYAVYRSDLLNAIIVPVRKMPPVKKALLLTALLLAIMLLIFVCIFVVRGILYLLGKDKLSNYRKYSRRVFHEIPGEKQADQMILYRPIPLVRDKLRSILVWFAVILAILAAIVLLFYVNAVNDWSFLGAFFIMLGGFVAAVAVAVFAAWLIFRIRSKRQENRDADPAKVRIIKINGGKRDGQ